MSQHNENSKKVKSPYNVVKIGLTATDRQYLYDRINKRVDIMLCKGLVEEAKSALDVRHSATSRMAIGHKELLPYFLGEESLDKCVENLKMQSRRYAKRQLTWFKRDEQINWLEIDLLNNEQLLAKAIQIIKKELFDE